MADGPFRLSCHVLVDDKISPCFQLSVFRGSAWEYVEERGQFYYHAFLKEQPDLNYQNPLVVDSMKVIRPDKVISLLIFILKNFCDVNLKGSIIYLYTILID